MYGYYHDLKKKELEQAKQELKALDPNSEKYEYVNERINYLVDDLYNLENKN